MSTETQASIFTPAELEYLQSQRLCRMATAGDNQQPHVTPVAFRYNADTNTFDIAGHGGFTRRKKWRDLQANPQIALVIDDIASVNPWKVRGIEIRGTVELLSSGGDTVIPGADPDMIHVTPKRVVSWGIEGEAYGPPHARTVG